MRILRGSPAELGEAWLTAYLRKGLSGRIPDCPRDGKRGVTRHLSYKTNILLMYLNQFKKMDFAYGSFYKKLHAAVFMLTKPNHRSKVH